MLDRPFDITMSPGNGHTGYARPFWIGRRCYTYSLYGDEYKALWTSLDGRSWNFVKHLGRQTEQIINVPGFENDWQWSWINSAVIKWQGQVWMFSQIGQTAGGANAGAAREIYVAPLTEDMTALAAPPVNVTPAAQGWEGSAGIQQLGNAFAWDDRLFISYRTSQTGGFGVMEVELY